MWAAANTTLRGTHGCRHTLACVGGHLPTFKEALHPQLCHCGSLALPPNQYQSGCQVTLWVHLSWGHSRLPGLGGCLGSGACCLDFCVVVGLRCVCLPLAVLRCCPLASGVYCSRQHSPSHALADVGGHLLTQQQAVPHIHLSTALCCHQTWLSADALLCSGVLSRRCVVVGLALKCACLWQSSRAVFVHRACTASAITTPLA